MAMSWLIDLVLDNGCFLIVSNHPLSDDLIEEITDHIGIQFWGEDQEFVP